MHIVWSCSSSCSCSYGVYLTVTWLLAEEQCLKEHAAWKLEFTSSQWAYHKAFHTCQSFMFTPRAWQIWMSQVPMQADDRLVEVAHNRWHPVGACVGVFAEVCFYCFGHLLCNGQCKEYILLIVMYINNCVMRWAFFLVLWVCSHFTDGTQQVSKPGIF